MSLAKLIPITLHGIADYAVGLLLIITPFLMAFNDGNGGNVATWVGVVVGAAVIVVSALTDYPYSLVKLIPIQLHSLADYAVGILLIIVPIVAYAGTTAAAVQIVLGAAVIA